MRSHPLGILAVKAYEPCHRLFICSNFIFFFQFTLLALRCLRNGNMLPGEIPGKQSKRENALLIRPTTMAATYWAHILWYLLELYVYYELGGSHLLSKYPGTVGHHVFAALIAGIALVEPQWQTSFLFHVPWIFHALAFVLLYFISNGEFGLGVRFLPFVVYNVLLMGCCGYGMVQGAGERWRRFSPLVPMLGLLMSIANYEQYCVELKGSVCLHNRDHNVSGVVPWTMSTSVVIFGLVHYSVCMYAFELDTRGRLRKR